jgi:hypothetical protein
MKIAGGVSLKSPEKSGATGMNDAFPEEACETVNRCGAT